MTEKPNFDINKTPGFKNSLNREDFLKVLGEILDARGYSSIRVRKSAKPPSRTYSTNQHFWNDVNNDQFYEGESIALENFHVTEWIPLSPGKFYTKDGSHFRKLAKNEYIGDSIYTPLGKAYMINGGISSLRLSSKEISGKKFHIFGATSTGRAYQGVPIAIDRNLAVDLLPEVKKSGGYQCDLSGTLEIIPPEWSMIRYFEKLPKLYLNIREVELLEPSKSNKLSATISIIFNSPYSWDDDILTIGKFETSKTKAMAYWHFNPSKKDGEKGSILIAIRNLLDYANIHSGKAKPLIFCDVDEHHNWFQEGPIPLEMTLPELMKHNLDSHIKVIIEKYFQVNYYQEDMQYSPNKYVIFDLNQLFSYLDKKFERVDEKFDGVEDRFDEVDRKLDVLESQLLEAKDIIALNLMLNDQFPSFISKLKTLLKKIAEIDISKQEIDNFTSKEQRLLKEAGNIIRMFTISGRSIELKNSMAAGRWEIFNRIDSWLKQHPRVKGFFINVKKAYSVFKSIREEIRFFTELLMLC